MYAIRSYYDPGDGPQEQPVDHEEEYPEGEHGDRKRKENENRADHGVHKPQNRITSYNVCYTKLLRASPPRGPWPGPCGLRAPLPPARGAWIVRSFPYDCLPAYPYGQSVTVGISSKFSVVGGESVRRITSYNVCYTKLLRSPKLAASVWAA